MKTLPSSRQAAEKNVKAVAGNVLAVRPDGVPNTPAAYSASLRLIPFFGKKRNGVLGFSPPRRRVFGKAPQYVFADAAGELFIAEENRAEVVLTQQFHLRYACAGRFRWPDFAPGRIVLQPSREAFRAFAIAGLAQTFGERPA